MWKWRELYGNRESGMAVERELYGSRERDMAGERELYGSRESGIQCGKYRIKESDIW